jgi:peptidoglycan LD-endopeptidase CwlK
MRNKYLFLFFAVSILSFILFFSDSFFSVINDSDLNIEPNIVNIKDQVVHIDTPVIIIDYHETDIVLDKLQVPDSIVNQMALVNVKYFGFDSLIHHGQIIVHHSVSYEISQIFNELLIEKFPIEKVIPAVYYNWDDDLSMRDNNTSSFNRRATNSGKLSSHALGLAIDINPRINPYIDRYGKTYPSNGTYNISQQGTITDSNQCFKIFRKYGWKWGGHWRYSKDYQHFSKDGK